MTSKEPTTIRCTCGQVEIRVTGKPILTTICHCDDCQRASSELERLENASGILDTAGGTAYVLFRRDRVSCSQGASLLRDHRIEDEPFTKRVVASSCNAPLYLDFEQGHWLSLFHSRFEDAPPIQMRTQTKHATNLRSVPRDAPQFKRTPWVLFSA